MANKLRYTDVWEETKMKRHKDFLLIAALFITLSVLIYFIHYLIFRDMHHIFIYMIGDLAFVPLEVFLVVLVIERLMNRQEKRVILNKLNMVVGAFFSEVGMQLLGDLLNSMDDHQAISQRLSVRADWTASDFRQASSFALKIEGQADSRRVDLEKLKTFLVTKRIFLLALLENPNLLEHERFTDLLWAVTHLSEELGAREHLADLPKTDLDHLSVDIERVYDRLAAEWINYARHLKSSYPFLFSLILRTHPFQEHPSPVVT
jgi:hypothetical protein